LPGHGRYGIIWMRGTVAKWQGRALQKLDQRFESARCLHSFCPLQPLRHPTTHMVVGTLRVSLFLPENYSLKDKRHDVKSLLARVSNQFHVAAAEVADNDNWQRATLGIACVSTDARHANEVLSRVVSFIESNLPEGGLEDYEVEILHLS
jgi:uncharacterized protein